MTNPTKIAFIGFGNMAKALLEGLAGTPATQLHVYSPSAYLQTSHSYVHKHQTAEHCLTRADIIVLAVKPAHMPAVLEEYARYIPKNSLVLSVAAGVTLAQIEHYLPAQAIIRCMPNTPVALGLGVIGAIANAACSPALYQKFETTFASLGSILWLADENACDALTAISGSGPAYVFAFIEAYTKAAQTLGFDAETAEKLAIQTAQGALALLDAYGKSPKALREAVTSKGGTTAAGLDVLAKADLDDILQKTFSAAYQRARTLGETTNAR